MFTANGSHVKMETVKINSHSLQLPSELCGSETIFNEFFSFETWKSLSPAIREHLTSNFLPDFCDDNIEEKEKTINTLLSRRIVNFNTEVLAKLQSSLASGKLQSSSKKKHKKGWPNKRDKLKSFEECQRICQMLKKLSKSRKTFLFEADGKKVELNSSAHSPRSAFQIYKRSMKRYFNELENISMVDDAELSPDDLEEYHVISMGNKRRKTNTKMNSSHLGTLDNDTNGSANLNSDDNWYKEAFVSHQRDNTSVKNEYDSINMRDVFERTQLDVRKSRSYSRSMIKKQSNKIGRSVGRPKAHRNIEEPGNKKKKEFELENINSVSNVKSEENSSSEMKFKPNVPQTNSDADSEKADNNTLKSLKREPGVDLKDSGNLPDLDAMGIIQMPLDFADVENMNLLEELNTTKMPELLQDTHACFLSLIRDILCSTPDHRMSLDELKRKVNFWLLNPITPLNDWYHQSENWFSLLPSAVHFLTGEFTDQPEDFVPYLEFKVHLNIYQWIGAGRDTDNNLVPLCKYWLSRRNDMGTSKGLISSKPKLEFGELVSMNSASDEASSLDRSLSPAPARFPTDWIVTKATTAEIEDFREQERRRYNSPHMSFTYYQHGYESVVGPIKGIYNQQLPGITKARGHNMLVHNRPNFVTILTLVRDAAARLPNGEGTRADICELLKSSQYINPAAGDQVLQTIVSGALDRMHTEPDPCVKYDSKRKIWIYLHRNRSESEFEKMHLQQQCVIKPKKIICKKTKMKSEKVVSTKAQHLPMMKILPAQDVITEKKTLVIDAKTVVPSVKTVTHKFIPHSSSNISPKVESRTSFGVLNSLTSPPNKSIINRSLVLPASAIKTTTQNFITTKITTQKPQTITATSSQFTTTTGFLSKITPNTLMNANKIKAPQTTVSQDNKIVLQSDLSELGKIGIIPQKIIQVSPSRLQANAKGNVLTLNKIPVSLANYTTSLNKKVIQVKPVSAALSNITEVPTLRRANIQIKAPTTVTNTVTPNKIVTSSIRPTSMVTVKNIKPLPILNMTTMKDDLPTGKVQPANKVSPMPVFITKTSDGMTVLNTNRPIFQATTASRTVTTKPNQSDAKPKFGIISPNRSLLLNTDKTQKTGSPVAQIVRVANPTSGQMKPISVPLSGIKVQQLPVSSLNQKDPKAKSIGQFVNAKFINVQPNSDNKLKTFSGIRMINASDLNIASINGKQVIIATKSIMGSQNPQNVVFQATNCSKFSDNKQTITLSKGNLQSGQSVGQPIILPKFQGGPINVKTMQGIKIIPFTPSMSASQLRGTTAKLIQTSPIIKKAEPSNK